MTLNGNNSQQSPTGIFHWSHFVVIGICWFIVILASPSAKRDDSWRFCIIATLIIYLLRLFFHVRDGILRQSKFRILLLRVIAWGSACAFAWSALQAFAKTHSPFSTLIGLMVFATCIGPLLVTLFYNWVRAEPSPISGWG